MRILIAFLLLPFFECAIAQTNQGTLNILENKAIIYLNQMYSGQDFDKACKKWDYITLKEAKEICKNENKGFKDQLSLMDAIKSKYKNFYLKNKNFVFLKIVDRKLAKEGGSSKAYFEYTYKEDVDGKSLNGNSFLYFIFDSHQSQWKIVDFRVPTILGDPTIWMK